MSAPPTPAAATRPRHRRLIVTGLVVVVGMAMALGTAVALNLTDHSSAASIAPGADTDADAGEVVREPAAETGSDPFTPSVEDAGDQPATLPTPAAPRPDSGSPLRGDSPGLYGAVRDDRVCDSAQLIGFLRDDPAKAAAWAAAVDIPPTAIDAYIEDLTPVRLRADTRVTNHGYREGRAVARQSVLQAGTAVLVDDLGRPRVKCGCGNPLRDPSTTEGAARYTGNGWPGFDPSQVVVVTAAPRPVDRFVLFDAPTGQTVVRAPGSTGRTEDVDAQTSEGTRRPAGSQPTSSDSTAPGPETSARAGERGAPDEPRSGSDGSPCPGGTQPEKDASTCPTDRPTTATSVDPADQDPDPTRAGERPTAEANPG
jgi:hypothetical protein